MVLQRLSGKTEGAAPVLTLITQFGGGKTHTLTSLYHLANTGKKASGFPGVADLIREAGIGEGDDPHLSAEVRQRAIRKITGKVRSDESLARTGW
jgi:hypothetical protein